MASVNKVILLERLLSKIAVDQETGCWNWQGAKSKGYGILSSAFKKPPHKAHRLSYELHVGPIPDGLVVRHKCDNPACCNPKHLLLGTQRDNARDAVARNRLNPKSRLNLRPGRPGHHGAGPLSNLEIMNGFGQ